MDRKNKRRRWTEPLIILFLLFAAVLVAGPLSVFAQDGQSQRWVEVYVGTDNNVFVPAECVSGIEFQAGLTQEEAEQVEFPDFRLATITCDTGLFDAPGGNEIPGNSFVAGSIWFVNPVVWELDATADQLGQTDDVGDTQDEVQETQVQPDLSGQEAWIELQLTSVGPLVYVPATCVEGLPNFGSIAWQGSRDESITFARENQTPEQQALAQQAIAESAGLASQEEVDQFGFGHTFLVTLGCTTAAFNMPGGTALEPVQLAVGQTWFASPYLWFAEEVVTTPAIQQQPDETTEMEDQTQDQTTDQQEQVDPQPTPQY